MEMRLNILIVMIMGVYLGQKMMTILMFVEKEVGSPHTTQTQQVHTSVFGCYLKMVNNSNLQFDYADELRLKNPGSTIKMAVNRVTLESPLDFKRAGLGTKKKDLYKLDEGVAKELFFKNSKAWTKTFQGLHSVSDIIDNNICEAFNSSIMESIFNSIITMLEEIRVNMITRIVAKRKQCSSWEYNYGPVMKKFDDNNKEGVD
ncbi:hypothetical protein PVK06_027795 [Gossypium arboreum]|uniref:Uncharacterized protein n=1 Tax=Gossypium arboreum TaxID=29729 RepID=A0ABR0P438_GOSAR|nr:hypothetical protein PVK06_027795 [Gossypium arboreum]